MDKNSQRLLNCLKILNSQESYKVVSIDEIKAIFGADFSQIDLKEQIKEMEKNNLIICKYIDDSNICYLVNNKIDYVLENSPQLNIIQSKMKNRIFLRILAQFAISFVATFLAIILFYLIFVW